MKKLLCVGIKLVGWKYYAYIPQTNGRQAPPGSITRTRLLVVSLYVILHYSIEEMREKLLSHTSVYSDLVRSVCCLLNPTKREMLLFYASNTVSLAFLNEKYQLLVAFMESKFRTGNFYLQSFAQNISIQCRLFSNDLKSSYLSLIFRYVVPDVTCFESVVYHTNTNRLPASTTQTRICHASLVRPGHHD